MQVVMRTLAAGPRGVYQAGTVQDVSDDEAALLIQGGYAVPYKTEPRTATIRPTENAMAARPKR